MKNRNRNEKQEAAQPRHALVPLDYKSHGPEFWECTLKMGNSSPDLIVTLSLN